MVLTRAQRKSSEPTTASSAASQAEASSSTDTTTAQSSVSTVNVSSSSSSSSSSSTAKGKSKKTQAKKIQQGNEAEPKKKSTKRSKKQDNAEEAPKKKRMTKKQLMDEALSHFPAQHRALQERLFRAHSQKMIVVQRTVVDPHTQKFDVLGSTGNKYTVQIGSTIKCECRDFLFRRTHCKHVLMVLTKVFHVNCTSSACRKLSLSTSELEDVFATCTPDASVIASAQVQRQLEHTLYGKPLLEDEGGQDGAKRRPLDTSDCPVCFEEFTEAELAAILFCKACGNNIHKTCFDAWSSQGRSKITCVYCRAEWEDKAKAKKVNLKALRNSEGYVNLGNIAGLSDKRDTSSYGVL